MHFNQKHDGISFGKQIHTISRATVTNKTVGDEEDAPASSSCCSHSHSRGSPQSSSPTLSQRACPPALQNCCFHKQPFYLRFRFYDMNLTDPNMELRSMGSLDASSTLTNVPWICVWKNFSQVDAGQHAFVQYSVLLTIFLQACPLTQLSQD